MSGMADVIAAHVPTTTSSTFNFPESGSGRTCRCGLTIDVLHSEMDDNDSDAQPYLDRKLAAHVAEELTKAGFGKVATFDTEHDFGDPNPVRVPSAFLGFFQLSGGKP